MRIGDYKLCIWCMHKLDHEDNCHYCGRIQEEYHSSPRHLMPGTILAGKYVVGRVLGEGNFGITYIGYDKVLENIVAVKEFYPEDLVSRDVLRGSDSKVQVFECGETEQYQKKLDDFLNEARCLIKFDKLPSIVSVKDFFYENNTAYIVMEYVDGENIKKYVEEHGPIPGEKVMEWMKPLIHSLGRIHGTGMIHRDISPDNILCSENGLVLIDFGAARVRNMELTRSLTVVFKRGYSPEEQYRTKGLQGAWTDLYALCATMYFMLTGTEPEEATQRVLSDEVVSLVDLPEVTLTHLQKKAIMKGMSVKRENRYQSMDMLANALYKEKKSSLPILKYKVIAVFVVILILGLGIGYKKNAQSSGLLSSEWTEIQKLGISVKMPAGWEVNKTEDTAFAKKKDADNIRMGVHIRWNSGSLKTVSDGMDEEGAKKLCRQLSFRYEMETSELVEISGRNYYHTCFIYNGSIQERFITAQGGQWLEFFMYSDNDKFDKDDRERFQMVARCARLNFSGIDYSELKPADADEDAFEISSSLTIADGLGISVKLPGHCNISEADEKIIALYQGSTYNNPYELQFTKKEMRDSSVVDNGMNENTLKVIKNAEENEFGHKILNTEIENLSDGNGKSRMYLYLRETDSEKKYITLITMVNGMQYNYRLSYDFFVTYCGARKALEEIVQTVVYR